LKATGTLEARRAPPPDPRFLRRARAGGFVAIAVGWTLFVLILVAVFTR
jgi:hypothetical protein